LTQNKYFVFSAVYVSLLLLIGFAGCDLFPTQSKVGLPDDHDQQLGYALHKKGFYVPLSHCKDCHSQHGTTELKGGLS
jgi:uncharacterized protein (DUF924 family)